MEPVDEATVCFCAHGVQHRPWQGLLQQSWPRGGLRGDRSRGGVRERPQQVAAARRALYRQQLPQRQERVRERQQRPRQLRVGGGPGNVTLTLTIISSQDVKL